MSTLTDRFNPEYPRTAGLEWAPTRGGVEALDPSVGLGVRFRTRRAESAQGAAVWLTEPPLGDLIHTLIMSVYPAGFTLPPPPDQLVLFPSGGFSVVGGTAVVVGALDVSIALDPSLASYVSMPDTTANFNVSFGVPESAVDPKLGGVTGRRVLDVSFTVLYEVIATSVLAEGDPPHSATLILSNEYNLADAAPIALQGDSIRVPLALNAPDTVTAGFGEVHPNTYRTAGDYRRRVWLPSDITSPWQIGAPGFGRLRVAVEGNFDSVRIYSLRMIVTVTDERRVAAAALRYDAASIPPPDLPQWSHVAPLYALPSEATGWVPNPGVDYVLTAGEAITATGDVDATGQVFGEPFKTSWLQDVRNGRFGGAKISRDSLGAETAVVEVGRAWPVVLTDVGGRAVPGSQPYARLSPGRVWAGNTSVFQQVIVVAGTTFHQARFMARRFGNSGPLVPETSGVGANAPITGAELDALPDLGDGWRQVTVPLMLNVTPVSVALAMKFTSPASTTYADRWEIAGADSGLIANAFVLDTTVRTGGRADYFAESTYEGGYRVDPFGPFSGIGSNGINGAFSGDAALDYGFIFSVIPASLTGLAVTAGSVEVVGGTVGDGPDDPAMAASVPYAVVSWDRLAAADQAGFCHYEVARRDTPDDPWWVVGRSFDPAVATLQDRESPMGARSQWRVRRVNADGVASSWTPPAPDYARYLTGGGVMTDDTSYSVTASTLVDIRVDAALNDWTPPAIAGLFNKARGTPGAIEMRVLTSGAIRVKLGAFQFDFNAPGFVDGTRHWLRVTGAFNGQMTLFSSDDGEVWRRVHSAGYVNQAYTSSGPLYIGDNEIESEPVNGRVYAAKILMGGAAIVDVSFEDWPLGGAAYTDDEGRLWSFVNGRIREGSQLPVIPADPVDCADGDADCEPVLYFTSNCDLTRVLRLPLLGSGEGFGFGEAADLSMQRMHGRDYETAFRPLERGAVSFERQLLVNAIQHPAAWLDAAFGDLRDLAWDDLPYVCVRDSTGRRWYAAISVPAGGVTRAPNLYVATVLVTEVTDRPVYAEARST